MVFSPGLTVPDSTLQIMLGMFLWGSERTGDRFSMPTLENRGRYGESRKHSLQWS